MYVCMYVCVCVCVCVGGCMPASMHACVCTIFVVDVFVSSSRKIFTIKYIAHGYTLYFAWL